MDRDSQLVTVMRLCQDGAFPIRPTYDSSAGSRQIRSLMDLSIVIITLNEEASLGRCLASLPPDCETIVLDSGSVDATEKIAAEHGARFETRAFDNYASQKNAAAELASRRWILSLDADEELTPALRAQIEQVVRENSSATVAYRIRRRLHFMQKQMRFGGTADRPIRLYLRGRAKFQKAIHESLVVDGRIGFLSATLNHFSYADLSDFFPRLNRYTSMIANEQFAAGRRSPSTVRMIARTGWEFASRYLLRGGVLDGYPGLTYALLSCGYVYLKYAKLREHHQRPPTPGPPAPLSRTVPETAARTHKVS